MPWLISSRRLVIIGFLLRVGLLFYARPSFRVRWPVAAAHLYFFVCLSLSPAESRRRHCAAPVHCCRTAQFFAAAGLFRCSIRGRHEVNLSHLDLPPSGGDAFARPCHRLVHVSAFQYPTTADVFLGLKVRPVA